MKHIFENEYMEKYLPKEYLGSGYRGRLNSFLSDLSYSLYGERKTHGEFNYNMRNQQLKYINSIRDMSIVEMREDTIITFCEKLSKLVIKDFMDKYNIKEKEDNSYQLSIDRYNDDYYKSLKGKIQISLNRCDGLSAIENFPKEYIANLDKCNTIYKILNCKNVPILYRRVYFLNEVISKLFPCEDINRKDKFCCITYNTYEYSREIEFE